MKKKSYTHLSDEERVEIYALKKAGLKQYEIAAHLGRDPSSISRELKRNSGKSQPSNRTNTF